jgi:DNA primase
MISRETIDNILQLNIADVVGDYVQLKKQGANYVGLCPFHTEKTPSFIVSPAKNTCRCFGCGKGGNAISFLMELKNMSYPEAIRTIARDKGIEVIEPEQTEQDKQQEITKESLFKANQIAAQFFMDELQKNTEALKYVKGRWNDETIVSFQLGYAPDSWDSFKKFAASQGIKEELLLQAGLLSESKGKVFDCFRNRIMFPIHEKYGRISGFTGRIFSAVKDDKAPKYFNTTETPIFKKEQSLYGLHMAMRAIRTDDHIRLVEGNPDVLRMHQIGKHNTVATCGTALTEEHIKQLKSLCKSVTIIGDSDQAGLKAMRRSAELIIKSGMYCNVIPLPTDQKNDPDSFFTDDVQFDQYANENIKDYIYYYAAERESKCKSPDYKTRLIDEIAKMVYSLPEGSHNIYIEQLSKIIKPKKLWQDAIRVYKDNDIERDDVGIQIPKHVSLSDYERFGFYIDRNCYFFKSKYDIICGSNFIMEPLFHIASVLNAKRLYRIRNIYGSEEVIELAQRDMISLSAFKLRVESLGNFLFDGTEAHLNRLKHFLYEKTQTCIEVTQLGWQKAGFWAWSNGIFNGKFTKLDENGIVSYNDVNYYIPATSNIFSSEENLFVSERKFRYKEGKITLYDYSHKLIDVYGDNAIIGLCFYFATLFRDYLVNIFGWFPILNLFGPKGAGKTELAISLLQFFGPQSKGPNITNTTKPGLADHVAIFSNALVHIDEYKNNIEYEKIEFLKGLWDLMGRTRMNMDKDKKKETTSVDVGVIVSGQEMPTADIALFSRLIFCSFTKVEYTDTEKLKFNELKEIEKKGISHITHEILQHREYFKENFKENYEAASAELTEEINNAVIEDRIFKNWLLVIAAFRTLKDKISISMDYTEVVKLAGSLIVRQNQETKKNNELSIFWSIVEFLFRDNQLREDEDFKVDCVTKLKTDKVNVDWGQPRTVIYLNHTRIFQLYRLHGQKTKENILPLKTLEYYLMNNKTYLGKKQSVAFKIRQENLQEPESTKRFITSAMAFDYEGININLVNTGKDEDKPNRLSTPKESTEKIPF